MPKQAKTEFLQIRLTERDRERIWSAAAADHLDPSAWARRILLAAADAWESGRTSSPTVDITSDPRHRPG